MSVAMNEIKPDRKFMFGIIARQIFDAKLDFTALDKDIPELRDAYEGTPPGTVYHYTPFAGLKGIVGTHNMWCSSVLSMNDALEFHHAYRLFKWAIPKVRKRLNRHVGLKNLADKFRRDITINSIRAPIFSHYITCFTDKRDCPSQWERYANTGDGASIGFEGNYFRQLAHHLNTRLSNQPDSDGEYFQFRFVRVIYNVDLSSYIVIQTCRHLGDFIAANDITERRPQLFSRLYIFAHAILQTLAIVLKDITWHQEQEWRLACHYDNHRDVTPSTILSRNGQYGPTRYFNVKLDTLGAPVASPIKEIMFGPGDIVKGPCVSTELRYNYSDLLHNTALLYSTNCALK